MGCGWCVVRSSVRSSMSHKQSSYKCDVDKVLHECVYVCAGAVVCVCVCVVHQCTHVEASVKGYQRFPRATVQARYVYSFIRKTNNPSNPLTNLTLDNPDPHPIPKQHPTLNILHSSSYTLLLFLSFLVSSSRVLSCALVLIGLLSRSSTPFGT